MAHSRRRIIIYPYNIALKDSVKNSCVRRAGFLRVHQLVAHLFKKGFNQRRTTKTDACRPQKRDSCQTGLPISSTPTHAVAAHCDLQG